MDKNPTETDAGEPQSIVQPMIDELKAARPDNPPQDDETPPPRGPIHPPQPVEHHHHHEDSEPAQS